MKVLDRLSRPLQRRCTNCKRSQSVPLDTLYHVIVPNKGGGTRRDGGFDCRFCGHENVVAPAELPPGLLASLPTHAERRLASAATPPGPVAVQPAAPLPLPVTKVMARPPAAKLKPPSWVVGTAAKQLLLTACRQSSRDATGFRTAFVRRSDGVLTINDTVPKGESGDLLDWLDKTACELLVVGGSNADGSRWKAVFHPTAGAATLAVEPVLRPDDED